MLCPVRLFDSSKLIAERTAIVDSRVGMADIFWSGLRPPMGCKKT